VGSSGSAGRADREGALPCCTRSESCELSSVPSLRVPSPCRSPGVEVRGPTRATTPNEPSAAMGYSLCHRGTACRGLAMVRTLCHRGTACCSPAAVRTFSSSFSPMAQRTRRGAHTSRWPGSTRRTRLSMRVRRVFRSGEMLLARASARVRAIEIGRRSRRQVEALFDPALACFPLPTGTPIGDRRNTDKWKKQQPRCNVESDVTRHMTSLSGQVDGNGARGTSPSTLVRGVWGNPMEAFVTVATCGADPHVM
jgi:hypothetical protein